MRKLFSTLLPAVALHAAGLTHAGGLRHAGGLSPVAAAPPRARTAPSPTDLARYAAEAARVTIIRDNWGIPHIYGKSDADAVFGLMYEECAHDFPRVEKNYLEVMGRQAEAYGADYLPEDLELQLIEDTADAKRDYQNSPPWLVQLLDAFADGVNYYLYKHPGCHPAILTHFEPWFPLMFTDGSVAATSTGGIRPAEVMDFYLNHRGDAAYNARGGDALGAVGNAATPDAPETGSNGFAIAPGRTRNGHALLYINPHVPFYFRLEVHLVSDEGLNAYGAVTWGQFFVYQGFNAHCGWMHTSSYADVADLYKEDVQGLQYLYDGRRKPLRTKRLGIGVKKGDDITRIPVTAYYTGHGPVMGERDGRWLSLKENNRSLKALMEAWLTTKAGTFAQYKKEMDLRSNTTNNTVYADDYGNIAYWHGNFMPKRDTTLDWTQPVDGTTSATEWQGTYSPDELVRVFNPSTGWIQNCNSTPYAVSGDASPRRNDYPAYMAPDGQNFRSVNAIRLLQNARGLTLDSLIAKGYNRYLAAFEVLLPPILKISDTALDEPIAILKAWDRYASDTSIATTLAVEWGTLMTRHMPRLAYAERASWQTDNIQKEVDSSTDAQKLTDLRTVVADLRARFGTWRVPWGAENRYQRLTGNIQETYDDNRPSIPIASVASAFGCLPSFVSRIMPGVKKRYGFSGNSFIAAVEFGPRVHAKTIITGGESSDPKDPHFTDQAEGYATGQFKDVYFYKEDIEAHAERTYHPGE